MRLCLPIFGSLLLVFSLAACIGGSDNDIDFDKQYNEVKAREIARSFESGEVEDIESYVNANTFIQHDLTIADGRQGLIDAVEAAQADEREIDLSFWRVFSEGDFVVYHISYVWFDEKKVGFEVFRFEDNLIVEHWINRQDRATTSVSGWSMLDGGTTVNDDEDTTASKDLITRFVNEVMINRQTDNIETYFDDGDLIQHNPNVDSDMDAFVQALNDDVFGTYQTLHRVIAEHNFVLTMSEGEKDGEQTAFFDLYRLYDGEIVEHWDVVETIPAQETWANGNGKF